MWGLPLAPKAFYEVSGERQRRKASDTNVIKCHRKPKRFQFMPRLRFWGRLFSL